MAVVRCPRCMKAIPQRPVPARCEKCGERLHRCRYCSHMEPRTRSCLHPEAFDAGRITDPDEPRECEFFVLHPPGYTTTRTFLTISWPAWRFIIIMLLLGGFTYWGLQSYLAQGIMFGGMEFRLKPTGTVERGENFNVVYRIYNPRHKTCNHVTITVTAQTMKSFNYIGADPAPQQISRRGNNLDLDMGDIPAQDALLGNIIFTSDKEGQRAMRMTLSASNISHSSIAETHVRVSP
jgi:hypothetical protein